MMLAEPPRSSKDALLQYARKKYERPTICIVVAVLLLALLILSPVLLIRRLTLCVEYSQAGVAQRLPKADEHMYVTVPIVITSENMWSTFVSLTVDAYLGEKTGVRFARIAADHMRIYGGGSTTTMARATPQLLRSPDNIRRTGDFILEHCGHHLAEDAAHATDFWPLLLHVQARIFGIYPVSFEVVSEQPCVAGETTSGPVVVPGLPGLPPFVGFPGLRASEEKVCQVPALCAWSSCFSMGCSPFDLNCQDQAEPHPTHQQA
jgi:hypothetical protein